MTDDLLPDDVHEPDAAFEQLVRLALTDSVPDDVVARSRSLFAFSSIDAELATLLAAESADLAAAGVRSTATVVTFTFVTDSVTIEIEHDGETLSGQLLPGGRADLELRPADGDPVNFAANSVGTFELDGVGEGSWCLIVQSPDGAVRTPWFTL